MKKVTFCQLKTSLSRNLVYYLQTFRDIVKSIFVILLQIRHGNNFPPTSKHRQAKGRQFLGICLYNPFIYHSNFVFHDGLLLGENLPDALLRSRDDATN